MTELQKYLAEEVAEDHVDGIITRREAIRRLGLLGVGAATASTMLAAEAAAAKDSGGRGHRAGPGTATPTGRRPIGHRSTRCRSRSTGPTARSWRRGRRPPRRAARSWSSTRTAA